MAICGMRHLPPPKYAYTIHTSFTDFHQVPLTFPRAVVGDLQGTNK